jgi:lipopolysaccharide/colanic/teichoic acid biosynthesis glycosyltransferase
LLVTFPLLLLAAIAIKVDSRGTVIFRQQRVGRNGTRFDMLKLRTMVPNAEELMYLLREQNDADGPLFKLREDPRVTRVGRVLRRYSLDELPQLWNVLRGDMSLVGPRPALPLETLDWTGELSRRLTVRPGLTGMWQVRPRDGWSFEDYTRLDLYYVDNWSLFTDLAILAKTLPAVLAGHGY